MPPISTGIARKPVNGSWPLPAAPVWPCGPGWRGLWLFPPPLLPPPLLLLGPPLGWWCWPSPRTPPGGLVEVGVGVGVVGVDGVGVGVVDVDGVGVGVTEPYSAMLAS